MHQVVAEAQRMRVTPPAVHRDDVDGLRAVAVLAILAFHLDLAGFSGGFVGVDVFFVISGYVILRSILPDLEYGRFSLADFLIRRVRRILPALMVVLAATLAAGFLILSPQELLRLGESALAAAGSVANLYFHGQTGYFASVGHTRPLLHMWSLGVEEQFYVVVPFLLAVLARRRSVSAANALVALTAASLIFSVIAAMAVSDKYAFYMPMARFWEIAVGGCIAARRQNLGLSRRGANAAGIVGLIAIVFSVLFLDSSAGGQRWVIIPVLGAALVIAAGTSTWTAQALESPPLAAIGRWSFSIYLIHWPLIVFWRLLVVRELLPAEQALIAALTIILAALLHVAVERPMRAGSRAKIGNRPALIGIGAATAAVAAAGIVCIADRGAPWRLRQPAHEAYELLQSALADRPRCQEERSRFSPCWWNPRVSGTDFAILGDSHALALAPELATFLGDAGTKRGVSLIRINCTIIDGVKAVGRAERECPEFMTAAMDAIKREKPRIVVIAARWAYVASDVPAPSDHSRGASALLDLENGGARIEMAEALVRTVKRIRASGAKVIFVGPVPEIDFNVPQVLVRFLEGVSSLPPTRVVDFYVRQRRVLDALKKVSTIDGVTVVYPHRSLCDEETCAVTEGPRALYSDDDHLSPFGAARVIALIRAALADMKGPAVE